MQFQYAFKVGSPSQVSVTSAAAVSFDPAGTEHLICNAGTEPIYISDSDDVAANTGYALCAGVTLFITNKIYMICAANKTSTLTTIQAR
jgi:hypothetical protein